MALRSMRVSFNEIEMTVLKAARGAGMEWGLAEEAAQCARWLALFDLPWQSAILSVLNAGTWHATIERDGAYLRPEPPSDWLCPIRTGAYLSDLGGDKPQSIEQVCRPILLLPFAARRSGRLLLSWKNARFCLDSGKPSIAGKSTDLDPPRVDRIAIEVQNVPHSIPLGVECRSLYFQKNYAGMG